MRGFRFASFVLAATLSMYVIPSRADSVDFNFQNGTLSYTSAGVVTGTVTASILGSGPELQVARNGTTNLGPYSILGVITFTGGAFVSGNGAAATPFDWSAGGNISVVAGSAATVGTTSLAGQTIFMGSFTGPQTAVINGTNATFTADFVGGTTDAALLAALGFPSGSTDLTGVMTENFVITSTAGQPLTASLSSGDLTLTPGAPPSVPEPGSLALLGAGLLGIVGVSRLKAANG
jgi:hypothetical protein